MTFARYRALRKRHRAAMEFQDDLTSNSMSLLANINLDSKQRSEPFHPKDFRILNRAVLESNSSVEALDLKAGLSGLPGRFIGKRSKKILAELRGEHAV